MGLWFGGQFNTIQFQEVKFKNRCVLRCLKTHLNLNMNYRDIFYVFVMEKYWEGVQKNH